MPSISTHMHFGKVLCEKLNSEIDLLNYIFGAISPKTILDEIEDYHTLDDDGNIDVREFYEKFNIRELSLESKSFILGYYSNLWFEEYYKFNASKLTIHNTNELPDEELAVALENTFKYYDLTSIGDFYKKVIKSIKGYIPDFNLNEIKYIDFDSVKKILTDYFDETDLPSVHKGLIDEDEYISFINKSCNKFLKSL